MAEHWKTSLHYHMLTGTVAIALLLPASVHAQLADVGAAMAVSGTATGSVEEQVKNMSLVDQLKLLKPILPEEAVKRQEQAAEAAGQQPSAESPEGAATPTAPSNPIVEKQQASRAAQPLGQKPPTELPASTTPAITAPAHVTRKAPELKRKGSLMFTRTSLDLYYDVIAGSYSPDTLAQGEGLETLPLQSIDETAVTLEPVEPLPVSKPNFRLGSILYLSPESWSVWLNQIRFRSIAPSDAESSLKLENVAEKTVEFVWQNEDLNRLHPNWQDEFVTLVDGVLSQTVHHDASQLTPEQQAQRQARKKKAFESGKYQWDYISPDGNIVIDSTNDIVKVTLALSQTFVSEQLKIVEGDAGSGTTVTPELEAGMADAQVLDAATTVEGTAAAPAATTPDGSVSLAAPAEDMDALVNEVFKE